MKHTKITILVTIALSTLFGGDNVPNCLLPEVSIKLVKPRKGGRSTTTGKAQCTIGEDTYTTVFVDKNKLSSEQLIEKTLKDIVLEENLKVWKSENVVATQLCQPEMAFKVEKAEYASEAKVLPCSGQHLNYDKPVVIIEGYDFGEYLGNPTSFNTLVKGMELKDIAPSKRNLLSELKALGYDVFLVDLPQHVHLDLNATSLLVQKTLQEIWGKTTKENPMKVIGISTGGVWATAASMYEYEKPATERLFQVSQVITSDSPHSGALLPLSIQKLLKAIDDKTPEDEDWFEINGKVRNGVEKAVDESFSSFIEILSSISAKQLLQYNEFDPLGLFHGAFYDSYHALINRNKNSDIEFCGLVSGSWTGGAQGMPDNEILIDFGGYNDKDIVGPNVEGGLDFTIYSPSISLWEEQLLRLELTYRFQGVNDDTNWFGKKYAFDYRVGNIENAPGGYLTVYKLLFDEVKNGVETYYNDYFIGLDASRTNFLPVYSSTGLGIISSQISNNQYTNYTELESSLGRMENYTFLDELYHENGNSGHAEFTSDGQQDWIMRKIVGEVNIVPTIITPLLLN